MNHTLDTFLTTIRSELLKFESKHNKKHNLKQEEYTGLKELSKNKHIIIKKAAKGSAVVVMNRRDYIREGYRQFSDKKFYTKLDYDPTNKVAEKLRTILIEMLNEKLITEKNFDYFTNQDFCEGRLYLLLKIHKTGSPGKPICSTVNHPTCKISKYINANIKKYMMEAPSYIKDTTDFISKLKDIPSLPGHSLLVTLDVISLYTNIPNEEGPRATYKKLLNDPTMRKHRSYMTLTKLVLPNTNFTFNNEHLTYKQEVLGTGFAPSYANIFMARFEEDALDNYHLKPLIWKRFIDNIFTIWAHGKEELEKSVEYLNIHKSIKFTCEHSTTEIPFLDTLVNVGVPPHD